MAKLHVTLPGLDMKNPVIPASGTFGFGYEFTKFYDINVLGSIATKGTTFTERYGNPLPRIAEGPAGMLNAIGLQNPGVHAVVNEEFDKLSNVFNGKVLANMGGHSLEEYIETAKVLSQSDIVGALELNISCPNVKEGGMAFGTSCTSAAEVVKAVREVYHKHLMVKLSPNVTNIQEIALAVEAAGADSGDGVGFSAGRGAL
jgi:dihydroorotate dehydrogenase (NAD+) catalytic subunit